MFESSVISYGNQTGSTRSERGQRFESSVISYGNQTIESWKIIENTFESSVISYGNQRMSLFLWSRLDLTKIFMRAKILLLLGYEHT